MAKRYHQSKRGHNKDSFNDEMRHDKGRGGFIFNERSEPYGDMEGRRTQEMEDAGMIHENRAAIANLPQEVMIKPYPKTGPYMPEGLNDDISGIDMQMDYDDSQRRSHFYPKKV
jgi:hypothetical protein